MNVKKQKLNYIRKKNSIRSGAILTEFFKFENGTAATIIRREIDDFIAGLKRLYRMDFILFGEPINGYENREEFEMDIFSVKIKVKKS